MSGCADTVRVSRECILPTIPRRSAKGTRDHFLLKPAALRMSTQPCTESLTYSAWLLTSRCAVSSVNYVSLMPVTGLDINIASGPPAGYAAVMHVLSPACTDSDLTDFRMVPGSSRRALLIKYLVKIFRGSLQTTPSPTSGG